MSLRPRAILVMTAIVALVVFSAVQDRVTAAGARRYTAMQRNAIAGRGPAVTIDEVMQPAIHESVRQGLTWGGSVLLAGFALAGALARRQASIR